MARHYGLKAETVEIIADPTFRAVLARWLKSLRSSLTFQVRRLLRCRTR